MRPKGKLTLCQTPDGCAKGTPEAQRTLNPQNQQVWEHYLECKATGHWPEPPDAIVEEHAGIIRGLEDEFARWQQGQLITMMEAFLTASSG
jgi:hypothetical protein